MTLILSAFNGEIAAWLNTVQEKKKSKISLGADFDIYYTSGLTAKGAPVVSAVTGIGKVTSYISTFELIKRCRPDRVIFAGISGAVDPGLRIGDIVVSDSITQYDIDYVAEKVLSGSSPGAVKSVIHTDKNLTAEIVSVVESLQKREDFQRSLVVGSTGSADIYMTPEMQKVYADVLTGVLTGREIVAVDMEGFSSAAAALAGHTPFAQIRIISDEADGRKPNAVDYREFIRSASGDLALILIGMML